MANAISLHKAYLKQLDEVYKADSKSAILDTAMIDSAVEAKTFTVDKIELSGLANYDRNNGYTNGDVTLTQEEVTPNYDRGRKFSVDAMDDLETGYIAFGKLGAEFERTKVLPEVDAFRFAKYATGAGTKVTGNITADNVVEAIDTAIAELTNKEVPETDRILFVRPSVYGALKQALPRRFGSEASIDRNIETFDMMPIVRVPEGRFTTTATLGANGYTADGEKINFLIVHKGAVAQFAKHKAGNVISPEDNQNADAYIMKYRHYGLAHIYENKTAGIYAHTEA
jgi:hypothetical protein